MSQHRRRKRAPTTAGCRQRRRCWLFESTDECAIGGSPFVRQPGGTRSLPIGREPGGRGKFLVKPVLWFRYTGAIKRKTDLSWPSVGAENFLERGECCAELCYGPWWRGFC